ncbi:hypothetical protein M9Y10_036724 [Tritrichomonas musculus]|uniref:NADH:flavin oxidoreductase/NADH oxidase N-terminal domain-containing protein n=1 Tax=Tritrichomonas musculus TaxID=1915356 RepID=A0ABR2GTL9_9EUKA
MSININTSIKIGHKECKNRLMRSSTCLGKGDERGVPSSDAYDLLVKLSEGSCSPGIIVSGFAFIDKNSVGLKGQIGLTQEACDITAEDWKRTIAKIHENGCLFLFQLSHGGAGTIDDEYRVVPSLLNNHVPSSSEYEEFDDSMFERKARELTVEEIQKIEDQFTYSAARAKEFGADGIQFSGGGYLVSTFLSPATNFRTDQYGGSDENRCRFLIEIVDKIRKETGDDFIISIKMNGCDKVTGGVTKELAARYVKILSDKIDLFEISSGLGVAKLPLKPGQKQPDPPKKPRVERPEGYNLPYAEYIKQQNPNAVIAVVGGIRHKEFVEDILQNKKSDIVSFCRPFLSNPHFCETLQ